MPRFARLHAPGALVHVIARFVNRSFRLAGEPERAAFLDRLPRALLQTDWTLLAYALMSSHVHLALLAGEAPPWRLLMPLHISVARWLNRHAGTFGPVFAERATTLAFAPERTAQLVAYLHNNPVRAGVVRAAAASRWTSHRAWLGQAAAPAWLSIELGLALAGFEPSAAGRAQFDAYVCAQASGGRDLTLSPDQTAARRAARARCGLPVELASAHQPDPARPPVHLLRHPGPLARPPRWLGDVRRILLLSAEAAGVPAQLLGLGSRERQVVRAKRLAMLTGCRLLGRPVLEMAAALGCSGPAGSYLLRGLGPSHDLWPVALRIAQVLRR